MTERRVIHCKDLDQEIVRLARQGYRLDMIMPADSPHEALMSNGDESLRLLPSSKFNVQSSTSQAGTVLEPRTLNFERAISSEWVVGRAGMMYRDLIPDRLGGKVIASHIRIIEGGEVADSVHYHKIDFQVIYCLKGAIRVVYESQGEPFRLRPGDCVLQPPEIRHRVLEAEAGSEVIEVTSPAEHETWFDHELQLPTEIVRADRVFGGQRFERHLAVDSKWQLGDVGEPSFSETNIPGIRILSMSAGEGVINIDRSDGIRLSILVDGNGIEARLNV